MTDSQHPPHIVVVGSLNMDLVVRTRRIPRPGETILGDDFRTIPGGKGANQAVAAARLNARVSMVGCVGQDAFGHTLLDNLRHERVNVAHVSQIADAPTGVAMITVDASGQNSIVVASGANMHLTSQQVQDALAALAPFQVLVIQLESPIEAVCAAAQQARALGARVILNPAPARTLPEELLQAVHVFIPNESETELLSGQKAATIDQARSASQALLASGPEAVIVTLGKQGALVASGEMIEHLPPHPVEVIDTTAAGDAFVAGVAVGLSEGLSLEEAARLGNASGALAVTKMGAQPAMPMRREVQALLTAPGKISRPGRA